MAEKRVTLAKFRRFDVPLDQYYWMYQDPTPDLHILQARLRHCLQHWGVQPRPIQSSPWLPRCQSVGHPMKEYTEGSNSTWGHNPSL